VKLKVEPDFNVRVETKRVPVQTVMENFDDLKNTCEFLELFWFPGQDTMWVMFMDRTDSPRDEISWFSRTKRKLKGRFQGLMARTLFPWVAKEFPNRVSIIIRLASEIGIVEGERVLSPEDAFHYPMTYPKNWDMSYAFPAALGKKAWELAMDQIRDYAKQEMYPVNLAVHGRFTEASSSWLAPDYGRPTAWVEMTTVKGTPEGLWRKFYEEVEALWFDLEDARPHWGKYYGFWQKEGAESHPNWSLLADRYPRFQDFCAVRNAWDLSRLFLNPFLAEHVFKSPPFVTATPQPRTPPGIQPTP
jgi:hypothetical protein